jgi:cellobiose phosphorylase
MARQRGESVAFSCMYAAGLRKLADLIRKSREKKIEVFQEIKILLLPCDYENISPKQSRLEAYFEKVKDGISGKKIALDAYKLQKDLEEKSEWMTQHIRRKEWLKESFFNGYYDNKGRRLEGRRKGRVRMMLASQVFAIMSGVAQDWQVKKTIASIKKYLFDRKLGGYRLNTNFGREQLDLGRAFSFSYGDKENGAIFSHMVVMYAYALYLRGYRKEGWKVLYSLYKLSTHTAKSKIYPCLPEYFNTEGRGMYSYLTGSASWFVLTMLTQALNKTGE